ncbi:hypothetical protein WJX79_006754 [Trebouxia sp. C0005]
MITVGVGTFLLLSSGFRAPYGRHKDKRYKHEVNGRIAWMTQEMWSCFIPLTLFLCNSGMAHSILQGTQLVYCRHVQVTPAQTVFGAIMWGVGFAVDVQSDLILQDLRRRHPQQGYQIPSGGLYKLVSCPNYLGETIEWTGYAITTNSLAGFAFAFYTFANLAPRAQHHHKWYKERFTDYPANRKAYIPYLW